MNQAIKMVMVLSVFAANLTLCSGAGADQKWLCSVGSAVAVDEDGTVGPPDLGDRERPTFFRVDAAKKELTLLAPASRRGEVTKFDTVHETDGAHLFSGVEHGRGLNLIINAEGRMSLSVVGDGVVWSVFGHALREGESDAPAQDEPEAESEGEPSEDPNNDSKDEPTTASKSESAAVTKDESKQEHVE
ncbi:MAG: hypothetical protein WCH77_00380 [Planctomycetota bacterium]